MKKAVSLTIIALSALAFLSCDKIDVESESQYKLRIDFKKDIAASIIYAAWVKDPSGSFIQNIFICNRLIDNSVANIINRKTIPYWRENVYTLSAADEVVAVSGASQKSTDFITPERLYKGSARQFKVYFEIDRSFDGNDWWTDQPSILYEADVDLDSVGTGATIPLHAIGWTRNSVSAGGGDGSNINKYPANPDPATSALGVLQTELRYIKNAAASAGTAFGAVYGDASAQDATNMTQSVSLTVTKL